MAENSGYLRHLFFSWGEMWTPLNWLCIELLVVTGQVLYYVWYTTRHHFYVIFLMMSDFEIQ